MVNNSFKRIKDLSSHLLFENTISVNGNSFSYNKFINEIKRSPVLKIQFIVYTNLENEKFQDKSVAEKFLQENMNLFNNFTKKDILDENEKLISKFKTLKINESLIEDDSIFKLILESCKDKKVAGILNRSKLFIEVVNKLLEVKPTLNEDVSLEIDTKLPIKKIIKRATEILNERYSFLNEKELQILKAFINNDNTQKEELYNNLMNENLKLVKRKLFEEESFEKEEIDSLNLTESKLKESIYKENIEIGEYSKLIELQETLK